MLFLMRFLEKITRKSRYRPVIVWSKNSVTHNIFRTYELVFGRKEGIRAEMRSSCDSESVFYELYTFEAYCAYTETVLRSYVKSVLKLKDYRLRVTRLQLSANPHGYTIPMAHFAIGLDTSSTFGTASGDTTSPTNWTHTCTGSDLTLVLGTHTSSGNTSVCSVSAATYNSVALTKTRADSNTTTQASESSIWMLGAPATGANSISFSWAGGFAPRTYGGVVSYTGTAASSTADAHNGVNGTGTGAKTVTVTTSADNSWVFSVMTNTGNTSTLTPTETSRWNNTTTVNQAKCGGSDLNGPKTPAGGQVMTWTVATTGTNHSLSGASVAPAAGGEGTVTPTRMLMGMGT